MRKQQQEMTLCFAWTNIYRLGKKKLCDIVTEKKKTMDQREMEEHGENE